jgi:phage/plasmid-associated DNA primase
LIEKLKAELPGILNRAIAACLLWQRTGLPQPPTTAKAGEEWRADSDPLTAFLDSDRVQFAADARATSRELYGCYVGWADAQSLPAWDRLSHKRFGTQLRRRFSSVEPKGVVTYVGLTITPGKWDV